MNNTFKAFLLANLMIFISPLLANACGKDQVQWKNPSEPYVLNSSGLVDTSTEQYKCSIDKYYFPESGFSLSCENGVKVEIGAGGYCGRGGIAYPDCEYDLYTNENGLQYKLKDEIKGESFECNGSEILWTLKYRLYQSSFGLNVTMNFVMKKSTGN